MILSLPLRLCAISLALILPTSALADPPTDPGAAKSAPPSDEPSGEIRLRDAVAAALLLNPSLAAFSWEIRAKESRAIQAGLRPNPTISVELENIAGRGQRSSFGQAETTIWLSQLVEVAGKRRNRRFVAELQRDLSQWDYNSNRLDVLSTTTKAFVAALVTQNRLALAKELETLAQVSLKTVARQVAAGAVPAVERTRAEVALLTAELERQRVERQFAADRITLAATWGSKSPQFSALHGNLSEQLALPPPLVELDDLIPDNPDIARWDTALAASEAAVSLERSRQVPNPTVNAGARHFNDNGDKAFVVGFSVPLPIFNRNHARVEAATRDLAKARAQKSAAEISSRARLARRYQDLTSAFEQAETLRARTLPAANRAFAGTRDGYDNGLFRYLDVLDAQRTLFELRARELQALSAYHQARTDIERMIGRPLSDGGTNS